MAGGSVVKNTCRGPQFNPQFPSHLPVTPVIEDLNSSFCPPRVTIHVAHTHADTHINKNKSKRKKLPSSSLKLELGKVEGLPEHLQSSLPQDGAEPTVLRPTIYFLRPSSSRAQLNSGLLLTAPHSLVTD